MYFHCVAKTPAKLPLGLPLSFPCYDPAQSKSTTGTGIDHRVRSIDHRVRSIKDHRVRSIKNAHPFSLQVIEVGFVHRGGAVDTE